MKKVRTSIYLTQDQHKQIKLYCAENGYNRTSLFNMLINGFFKSIQSKKNLNGLLKKINDVVYY